MRACALALALAAAPAVRAQPEPASPRGTVKDDTSEDVAAARRMLEADPLMREALATRILESKLADAVNRKGDPKEKKADVRAWIDSDLAAAAEVAVGLARDDANGTRQWENAAVRRFETAHERNPNMYRGALGVLREAGKGAKQAAGADQPAGDEERQEKLRKLFEGEGGMSGKVVGGKAPDGGAGAERPAAAAPLAGDYYDRLSAANLRGYSPQLMALQSAMNRSRPPGAPTLVETGKLDRATLAFPALSLRYDLGRLERRLRRAKTAELAAVLGRAPRPSDLDDEEFQERVLAEAKGRKPSPSLERLEAALESAGAALAAFEAAAARAKDPSAISRPLLAELGARRRDAARWLAIAALEEELAGDDAEFLTPELLAAIASAPAPPGVRASYRSRGEALRERRRERRAAASRALGLLAAAGWESRLEEADRLRAKARLLGAGLSRDVDAFRAAPARLAGAADPVPRWRRLYEDALLRWLPRTAAARAAASRRRRVDGARAAFAAIADGRFDDARAALGAP